MGASAEDRQIALITGISGQDGSYLAEFLLEKGYTVHGTVRPTHVSRDSGSRDSQHNPHQTLQKIELHAADLTDERAIANCILEVRPDEIYNLAAQSHVGLSFDLPGYTHQVNGAGALRVLEAARQLSLTKPVRVYQAASSEIFGAALEAPQSESTEFRPRNPYGHAKLYAYQQVIKYREVHGLFACNGIMYNHESPRRGEAFVTRKITRAVGRICQGLQRKLQLGNLDSVRDWGYAKEYVEAMWLMLQQPEPRDYVIATNENHTVREFLETAFACVDLDWQEFVEIDETQIRPVESCALRGDYSKARRHLGWKPSTTFRHLVSLMVKADCELAQLELPRARPLTRFELSLGLE